MVEKSYKIQYIVNVDHWVLMNSEGVVYSAQDLSDVVNFIQDTDPDALVNFLQDLES